MEHKILCDKCDKAFVTAGQLVRHLEFDHKEEVYNCNQCSYETKEGNLLMNHFKIKHSKSTWQCEICHMTIQIYPKNARRLHVKKSHDHSCNQCPRAFIRKQQLDLHVKVEHEGLEKSHFCKICNKKYLDLTKHIDKVHQTKYTKGQKSKTYPCTHCDIEFKSKLLLEKHKRKLVVRYY